MLKGQGQRSRSKVKIKGQGQRSKVEVKVKLKISFTTGAEWSMMVLGLPSAAKSPMKPKSDTLTGGHLKERSSCLRFQNVGVFKLVAR